MNEDLGLGLKITADTKALERDIKALSKKLIASITLDLSKAEAQLASLKSKVESKTFKSNLTLDVKPANTSLKEFQKDTKTHLAQINLDLDTRTADKTLVKYEKQTEKQVLKAQLDFILFEALSTLKAFKSDLKQDKEFKASLTFNLDKAIDQLQSLKNKTDALTFKAQLDLGLSEANKDLKDYRNLVESKPLKLTASLDKADAVLTSFRDKVEKKTIYVPFAAKQSDINALAKSLDVAITIDFKKAFDVLRKFKERIEKLSFKPALDLNVAPANAKIKELRANLKSNPLELDANVDKATEKLKAFQTKVANTTAYANVNVDNQRTTVTPVQPLVRPNIPSRPTTTPQPRVAPVEVIADTTEALNNIKTFTSLLNSLGSTEKKVTQDQVNAAKDRVKAYQEQVKAAEQLVNAVEKANNTLSKKGADLDAAKARVNLLQQQVQKTRELAAVGSRTDADVQVKQASLNQAKERVKILDAEIAKLRQLAGTQDEANRQLENSNNLLRSSQDQLKGVQGASGSANQAGSGLFSTFAKFSLIDQFIDRAVDALLQIPGAALRATLEVEKLTQQLDFSTSGNGAEQLEKLFVQSQRLGVSFQQLGSGYAQFSAAVKGSALENSTDAIFASVSKASAALKLSAEDSQGVFTALSQMASKGVISMEEFRQQLGERLPVATTAGVKALQILVDQGTVPITQINKTLVGATQETREAYRVTNADLIAYISSGKALASEFLPALGKALNETFKDVDTESLGQSIIRAQNILLKFGAAIGSVISPLLTIILNKFVEVFEYILSNTDAVFGAFKPFLAVGQAVVLAIQAIDTAFKALFGNGVIELIISTLDELAVALLLVFGAPLLGAIGSLIAAIAPIVGTILAIVAAVKLLKVGFDAIIEFLDKMSGGAITNGLEFLVDTFDKLKGKIKEVNDEIERNKDFLKLFAEEFGKVGKASGAAFNTVGLGKYTILMGDIQQAIDNLDIAKLESLADIDQRLAEGTISESTAINERLNVTIGTLEENLRLAGEAYTNAVNGLSEGVSGKAAEDLVKVRDQSLKDIESFKSQLAKATIEARQNAINLELEVVKLSGDALQRETAKAELKRIETIRQLAKEGNLNIKQAEEERLQLSADRIAKEIEQEDLRISALQKISSKMVEGSTEQNDVLNEIVAAEQKRSDLITAQAQLEVERQKSLELQAEAQALKLESQKKELEIAGELLGIAADLKSSQNELAQAQFTFASARLSLEQTLANVELDRLDQAVEANNILLKLDEDRRGVVAERLGLDPGLNEIELLRERVQQEEFISGIKEEQLLLQQTAERQALEFQRSQLKFELDQIKNKSKQQKIEADITKLKAEQAVASAIAARNAAVASGDTQAAAQAELAILQARQQSSFADDQLELMNAQNDSLRDQNKLQADLLDSQIEVLNVTHEQQRIELELETTAQSRANSLQTEQRLLEASLRARGIARKDALLALQYGTEENRVAADTIALQTELNDLEQEYSKQLELVSSLEASGVTNSNEELILADARNNLHETSLNLLEAEYKLEEKLANEVAQEREKALERQVSILEQRKTLIEAESGLMQAQSDLEQAKLEGRLNEIDFKEKTGKLSGSDAELERIKLQEKQLEIENEMLQKQQEADLKRLEIEQQIEIMRLRATQAEAEVTKARAEASLAESRSTLSRAIESGDQGAIDAANAAIEASQAGIDAAQEQSDLIEGQIESTLELQEIQMETLETQQKADEQRMANRERELEIAKEIAQLEQRQAREAEQNAEWDNPDGFRVSGGGVSAGNTYTVGEQGTELFQGSDGSMKLLGVNGQQAFTPNVPGKIISNQMLEQVIAANVMRSDAAVVEAIQQGFKRSGLDFSKLAGVLANRTQKPVVVNNYGSNNPPMFDANRAKLARL